MTTNISIPWWLGGARCFSPRSGFPVRSRRGLKPRATLRAAAWLGIWLGLASPLAALNPERKADSYSIQGWFAEHGLPSNKILAVTQARDGYLWLATEQGLARFDGSQFTVFDGTTHPALGEGGFSSALEAPDGALWFGGTRGLFRWQHGRFDRFTTQDGLASDYVRALALTRDGAIVACTRQGFSVVRDGRITTPDGIWRQVSGLGRAYLERSDGSILLGTSEGLWRIADGKIERLSDTAEYRGTAFLSLVETSDGSAWIGHSDGVICLRPDGKSERYGAAQGLSHARVVALLPDRDGNLWIAATGNLYRLAHGRIEAAGYASHLNGSLIQHLQEDHEGGLWIATGTGLFRLKDNASGNIGIAEGLAQTSVNSVFEAPEGGWWIGLLAGGVYRYDQTRAVRVPALAVLDLDRVLSFAAAPDGALWLGTDSGLYRYTGGALSNFYESTRAADWLKQFGETPEARLPGIAHPRVRALAIDGEQGLWAATEGALYHGVAGEFRAYTTADGLPGNFFESVIRARNGDIWVTVPPHGAARRREGQWTNYLSGRALSASRPVSGFEDSVGDIWITTQGGGLNRFRDGQWKTYTTREGLAHNFISGIVEDNSGTFWIAYPRGIMRIPRREFDELGNGTRAALQPRIFNTSDGLPRGETNPFGAPNALRSRDGRLLFATDLGVAVIDPSRAKINELRPPMHLERFVINGADADLSKPVSVPPGSSALQIHFTAISLLAPEKVRFKIRLTPLDRDWVDNDARREVHYAALPAGNYTFHAKASNNDGVWNEEGVALAFTIRPFFYRTVWFIGLLAATGVAGVFGVIKGRARNARRQVETLAELVDERTRQLQVEVADRTQAEKALRDSNEKFHQLADNITDAFWVRSPDMSEVHYVSPAFERIWGRSVASLHANPQQWADFIFPADRERVLGAFAALTVDASTLDIEYRIVRPDGENRWVRVRGFQILDSAAKLIRHVGIVSDITTWKEAEAALEKAHRELVDASRQAGMAEVATGVLHNVGNVLNSVNVSAGLITDGVRQSKATNVAKLAAMFDEHQADLATFLTQDPRGQMIPRYLGTLAESLHGEHEAMLKELDHLRKNIGHIKDIVGMQQNFAKNSGFIETVAVAELVEDALRMNVSSLLRHEVDVVRDFQHQPTISTDKHKVVQVLINLVGNAKYACDESGRTDKKITVRITHEGHAVRIAVIDNGIGIPAENLTRIFNHGFTTRKDGHGFGLHSSALAAKELGGSLTVHSDGPGTGATFTLELPFRAQTSSPFPL